MMTMITGLYGMNVQLPGQNVTSTFFIILGAMLVVSGGMFILFKKKKWI